MKTAVRTCVFLIMILVLSTSLFGQLTVKHTNEDSHYITTKAVQMSPSTRTNLNNQMIFNIASTGPIDPNGLRVSLTQKWSTNNLRWENLRKTVNEYPNNKVPTNAAVEVRRRYSYYWQNDNWVSSGWWGDETDDDGNYNKTVSYDTEGGTHQEIYYNGPYTNGQPASWLSLLKDGTEWVNHQRGNYAYNSDGNMTENTFENWENDSWVIQGRSVFIYTQPGCLDQMIWYSDDNGSWDANWRSTYVYGKTECMTEMVAYAPWPLQECNPTQVIAEISSDNGVTWTPSNTNTYGNFGTDCLPRSSEIVDNTTGGGKVLSINDNTGVAVAKTVFEYLALTGGKISSQYDNSNLRCTKLTTQNFTDGVWVNSEKTWYSYKGLMLDTKSETAIPDGFALAQNYPNPFNPNTTIDFSLTEGTNVMLTVYDLSGKLIKEMVNSPMQIGKYSILWDGTDNNGSKVGAGVYLYKLQTENFTESKKMILLK